jgi:hypothetical protein
MSASATCLTSRSSSEPNAARPVAVDVDLADDLTASVANQHDEIRTRFDPACQVVGGRLNVRNIHIGVLRDSRARDADAVLSIARWRAAVRHGTISALCTEPHRAERSRILIPQLGIVPVVEPSLRHVGQAAASVTAVGPASPSFNALISAAVIVSRLGSQTSASVRSWLELDTIMSAVSIQESCCGRIREQR